jgi:UDP:flavonoid glycosyltransferase YjiC (YdhE family)
LEPGVGHHGGHGTTAAAMVHPVLLINVCFVHDVYVNYTLLLQ